MTKEIKEIYDWENSARLIREFIPNLFEMQDDIKDHGLSKEMSKEDIEKIKSIGFKEDGRKPEEVLNQMTELIYPHRTKLNHPRCFSFIPGAFSPYSIMGDLVNSIYNPYGGSHSLSEGAAYVEKWLINWMGEQIGYSAPELGGVFVSGGSMANLTACVVARDNKLKNDEIHRGTVYISDQTHSSVAKGFHIMGIPRDNIRKISTDDNFKMNIEELENTIEIDKKNGFKPFLIVGTCGTTNTGAIDPLNEIAEICEKYNLWFHIDGSYGASAILSSYKDELKGVEKSDSISWDAHKWLFQTYGCALVICKDRQAMRKTYTANPEYLVDVMGNDDNINFWDIGMELTKPFRGIRLWFTLQTMGLDNMRKAIDHGFIASKWFEEKVLKYSDFEIISPAQMGIINFRYNNSKYREEELNKINHKLSQMATENNYALYYTTELNGKIVLRFCPINPILTKDEVINVIEEIRNNIDKLKII